MIENNQINCFSIGYDGFDDDKKEIVNNNLYDVASLTKVLITTTLVFKLINKGMMTLNSKIKSYLPKYKYEDTTIQDLMFHTSGLPAGVSNFDRIKTKDELIELIYNTELQYEAREKIVYSDIGFILLGFIVESLFNDSIDNVAKKEIFEVINMNNSTFNPSIEKAIQTEFDETINGYVKGFVHDERSRMFEGKSGHAGLFTNATDISKIINSILNDELLYTEEQKDLIFSTTLIKKSLNNIYNARTYGFQKYHQFPMEYDNLITHTGFTGCNMWIDRNTKRGFVLISNAVHPFRKDNKIFSYRQEILELFYK